MHAHFEITVILIYVNILHLVLKDKWVWLSAKHLWRLQLALGCEVVCRPAGLLREPKAGWTSPLPGVGVTGFESKNDPCRVTQLCPGSSLPHYLYELLRWRSRSLVLKSMDGWEKDSCCKQITEFRASTIQIGCNAVPKAKRLCSSKCILIHRCGRKEVTLYGGSSLGKRWLIWTSSMRWLQKINKFRVRLW